MIHKYLSMKLRAPETDDQREYLRIPLSTVNNCDHSSRVCPDVRCLLSWAIDYKIYLDRTSHGRTLRDSLDADTLKRVSPNRLT